LPGGKERDFAARKMFGKNKKDERGKKKKSISARRKKKELSCYLGVDVGERTKKNFRSGIKRKNLVINSSRH